MAETLIRLNVSPEMRPTDLVEAHKRVPLFHVDFVPVFIYGERFTFEEPTIEPVGDNAVRMTLDRPFGFMNCLDNNGVTHESQKTDGIVIAREGEQDRWLAVAETPKPLSIADEHLYRQGLGIYIAQGELAYLRNTLVDAI